jgi:hypothetical protein
MPANTSIGLPIGVPKTRDTPPPGISNPALFASTPASNVPIQLPEVVVPAPVGGNNLQDVIKPLSGMSSDTLRYPVDTPKYYLTFDVYEYRREQLQSIGMLGQSLQTIVMPLSLNLVDVTAEDWQEASIGVGGWAYDQASRAIRGININSVSDIAGLGDAVARSSTAAGLAVSGIAMNATAAAAQLVAGSAIDAGKAFLGISPNQFLTVLYVSPKYKRFEFAWQVAPHSKAEADALRKIGNAFKNAMSPELVLQGGLFKFPRIFKIAFQPNSKFMYKFKPSVLEICEINYTPNGPAAFFKAVDGENAPAHMNIRLRFIELEFWMRGNHNDSNNPNNVYTT